MESKMVHIISINDNEIYQEALCKVINQTSKRYCYYKEELPMIGKLWTALTQILIEGETKKEQIPQLTEDNKEENYINLFENFILKNNGIEEWKLSIRLIKAYNGLLVWIVDKNNKFIEYNLNICSK